MITAVYGRFLPEHLVSLGHNLVSCIQDKSRLRLVLIQYGVPAISCNVDPNNPAFETLMDLGLNTGRRAMSMISISLAGSDVTMLRTAILPW